MTAARMDGIPTSPSGVLIAGLQSAGTTTLLRHHLAELAVENQIRTDPMVRSLLRTGTGVQS